MDKPSKIKAYFEMEHPFKEALNQIRAVLLATELSEDYKWNSPVYTLDGKNVAGLARFKHHFGIWFFNGALLKDEQNVLHNAQEGKTKGLRQMRFEHLGEIDFNLLRNYVDEAIQNQKEGKEIKAAPAVKQVKIPQELKTAFDENPELESAFNNLTPGRQKDYVEHIETAKQEQTKQRRLEKIIPMILSGIGLNDKYKNC